MIKPRAKTNTANTTVKEPDQVGQDDFNMISSLSALLQQLTYCTCKNDNILVNVYMEGSERLIQLTVDCVPLNKVILSYCSFSSNLNVSQNLSESSTHFLTLIFSTSSHLIAFSLTLMYQELSYGTCQAHRTYHMAHISKCYYFLSEFMSCVSQTNLKGVQSLYFTNDYTGPGLPKSHISQPKFAHTMSMSARLACFKHLSSYHHCSQTIHLLKLIQIFSESFVGCSGIHIFP